MKSLHHKIMSTKSGFNEEEKIWSAKHTPTIFNPHNSLGHAILWSLEKSPNKIIQVKFAVNWISIVYWISYFDKFLMQISHDTNIQLTSEFIRTQTIRAATNLQMKMGCEPGDIISIIAKNSHFVAPIGIY